MSHAGPKLLQKHLKIGMGVTEASAMRACEEACRAVGFVVVSRSVNYLVLLPLPSQSILKCIASSPTLPLLQNPAAGHGFCIEIIPSASCDGRLTVSVAGDRSSKGKAFVAELRNRLRVSAHRARTAGAADAVAALRPPDATTLSASANSTRTAEMHADAPGYYAVSKLLCDHQDGSAGALAADFVDSFSNSYVQSQRTCPAAVNDDQREDIPLQDAPIPLVLHTARSICERATGMMAKLATPEAAHAAAEMAKPTQMDARTRLNIAVERYLFARVGPTVWHYYATEHKATDDVYLQKREALREVSDFNIMNDLEVHPCFFSKAWISQEGGSSAQVSPSRRAENTQDAASMEPACAKITSKDFSVRRAAMSLSRVEALLSGGLGSTPCEAIEALAIAHCEIKTCALEASCGSIDLTSMDDLLPVFIFVLVRSSINQPSACANLMSDTLTADERLGEQGKIATLMGAAARYVANTWNIDSLTGTAEEAVEDSH